LTPAAKRMERLQRWNLERLPALTEEMFRAVLARADRAYEKLPGSTTRPDDTG
jgi:hypothetical protein